MLSDEELAAIWGACRNDDFGRIVRLLILTGQRREEVGGMNWSEFESGPRPLDDSRQSHEERPRLMRCRYPSLLQTFSGELA